MHRSYGWVNNSAKRCYWFDGSKCHIRIYRKDGHHPVVICSQLPNNGNTSVTNMAEYLTAEVIEEHGLPMPMVSIEHYPEYERGIGGYSLVRFSSWEVSVTMPEGVWRVRIGTPLGPACPQR